MKTVLKLFCAAILLALSSSAQEHSREGGSQITGIWRWKFPMPDGSVANPTLRLEFEDGKLAGTSSFRAGSETSITNAIYNEKGIRFQVVRERNGKPVVTTYTGQLAGKTINGTIESNWAGESQTYPWHAEKLHGPAGTWEWTVTMGDRKFEARVTLKQVESKLEGTMAGRRGFRPTHIKKGVIDDDGQLSFEIETGPEDARRTSLYKGKLNGDTITGTVETTFKDVTRKSDWLAHRAF